MFLVESLDQKYYIAPMKSNARENSKIIDSGMAYEQLAFFSERETKEFTSLTHGGAKVKLKRKTKRPLINNKITHVVLKSSKAKGYLSFYKNKQKVHSLLKERSKKYFIEILDFVNMGNHLHLKVRFKDKNRFKNFLRTFTALLARKITSAKKGKVFGKFWDGLAYTRVLTSAYEILGLKGYFQANRIQRDYGYQAREKFLEKFNQKLYKLKKN